MTNLDIMDDGSELDFDRSNSRDFLLDMPPSHKKSSRGQNKSSKPYLGFPNPSRVFLKLTLFLVFILVVLCLLLLNASILSLDFNNSNSKNGEITLGDPVCKVHFILAGSKTDYNMRQFHTWLQYTKTGSLVNGTSSQCSIEFVREDHQLMKSSLTPSQRWVSNILFSRKIILADYMKLASVYYYGGAYADFDVELTKSFPQSWFSDSIQTKSCSLLLGVEHDCWTDDCIAPNNFAAKGQIENWVMAAQSPKSPFLLGLLGRIEKQIRANNDTIQGLSVQQVAGSGIYSLYLREVLAEMGLPDYGDIKGVLRGKTLKEDKEEVVHLQMPHTGEIVCLLGDHYLRSGLLATHHFEGSWKK